MIKLTYDCKVGTKYFYAALKNEIAELHFDNDPEGFEEEGRAYKYLTNATPKELRQYIEDTYDGDAFCDLLCTIFSDTVLDDDDFIEDAAIFGITNIKITLESDTDAKVC